MLKCLLNYYTCCCSGNGFGIKIVGGKIISEKSNEVGAFVTAIQRGGIADQLHGEVQEGKLFGDDTIFSIVCHWWWVRW